MKVQGEHMIRLWFKNDTSPLTLDAPAAYKVVQTLTNATKGKCLGPINKSVEIADISGTYLDTGNPHIKIQYVTYSNRKSDEPLEVLLSALANEVDADFSWFLQSSVRTAAGTIEAYRRKVSATRCLGQLLEKLPLDGDEEEVYEELIEQIESF